MQDESQQVRATACKALTNQLKNTSFAGFHLAACNLTALIYLFAYLHTTEAPVRPRPSVLLTRIRWSTPNSAWDGLNLSRGTGELDTPSKHLVIDLYVGIYVCIHAHVYRYILYICISTWSPGKQEPRPQRTTVHRVLPKGSASDLEASRLKGSPKELPDLR